MKSIGKDVLVLVELEANGSVSAASLSVVTFAQLLCQSTGAAFSLAVAADAASMQSHALRHLGATAIYHYPIDIVYLGCSGKLIETIASLIQRTASGYVIGAANDVGNDLMARLAGRFEAAFVGNCIGFRSSKPTPTFLRPMFGGSVVSECETSSPRVALTVQPTHFPPAKPEHDACRLHPTDGATSFDTLVQCLAWRTNAAQRPALQTARVVVAGGRPLGARYYDVLAPLADELGAALAASRALCDTGCVPSELQVGLTGTVIAPDLYLAVGISGSAQHLSGIRNAKAIVAINSDSRAPLFEFAKYGLVGDLWTLVPELVTMIRRCRGGPTEGA